MDVWNRYQLALRGVDAARSIGNGARASGFGVTFDRAFTVAGGERDTQRRRPYLLSCDTRSNVALRCLQPQLEAPLSRIGLSKRRTFSPHVTLLYGTTVATMQMIEPIISRVDRFALVHSHVGKSTHEVFEAWPLGGSWGRDCGLPQCATHAAAISADTAPPVAAIHRSKRALTLHTRRAYRSGRGRA